MRELHFVSAGCDYFSLKLFHKRNKHPRLLFRQYQGVRPYVLISLFYCEIKRFGGTPPKVAARFIIPLAQLTIHCTNNYLENLKQNLPMPKRS